MDQRSSVCRAAQMTASIGRPRRPLWPISRSRQLRTFEPLRTADIRGAHVYPAIAGIRCATRVRGRSLRAVHQPTSNLGRDLSS